MAAPDSLPDLNVPHRHRRHTLNSLVAASLLHGSDGRSARKSKPLSEQESVFLLDDRISPEDHPPEYLLAMRHCRWVLLLNARSKPDGYKPLPTQELRSLSTANGFSTGCALLTRKACPERLPTQFTKTGYDETANSRRTLKAS
jgi:hypothetical protein